MPLCQLQLYQHDKSGAIHAHIACTARSTNSIYVAAAHKCVQYVQLFENIFAIGICTKNRQCWQLESMQRIMRSSARLVVLPLVVLFVELFAIVSFFFRVVILGYLLSSFKHLSLSFYYIRVHQQQRRGYRTSIRPFFSKYLCVSHCVCVCIIILWIQNKIFSHNIINAKWKHICNEKQAHILYFEWKRCCWRCRLYCDFLMIFYCWWNVFFLLSLYRFAKCSLIKTYLVMNETIIRADTVSHAVEQYAQCAHIDFQKPL